MARSMLGAAAAMLLLAGCGGGGAGPVVNNAPPPAPPVTPNPPPSTFNTAEYQRSNAALQANAIEAYTRGADGSGVTVAVLDSGIDIDSAEFAGRLHPSSGDVVAGRTLDDSDGHGTSVAAVIAAARNDREIHGLAFGATLLALRTDTQGSCTGDPEGCSHADNDLARALDIAVASGARVVNMSLGGSPANNRLRNAIADATARGVIIVISAGNDEAANPDPLALIANDSAAARGLVLIAGATTEARTLADFSNRAGVGASHYIATLGSRVRSFDHTVQAFLFSGTSYAAPGIAGAAALLLDAFPSLTTAQVVDLLLRSTDDAGEAGTDAVYGRGILNLARAFSPQGQTSIAGTSIPVGPGGSAASVGQMGTAFGAPAALATALADVAIVDGYGRGFTADLGTGLRAAGQRRWLGAALAVGQTSHSITTPLLAATTSFTAPHGPQPWTYEADRADLAGRGGAARVASSTLVVQATPGLRIGYAEGATAALADRLGAGPGPAPMLAARTPGVSAALETSRARAIGAAHSAGGWTLAGHFETATLMGLRAASLPEARVDTLTVAVETTLAPGLALGGSLQSVRETGSLLGARAQGAVRFDGASTFVAGLDVGAALGAWQFSARYSHALTDGAVGGLAQSVEGLASNGWQVALARRDLFADGATLRVAVAQPLRVSGGALRLAVPTDYDAALGAATVSSRSVGLVPTGREVIVEAGYALPLAAGDLGINLVWRRDPGHVAASPDDRGIALRWSSRF